MDCPRQPIDCLQWIAQGDQWIARGDQWIASNGLPEATNGLAPINCFSYSYIFLHPLELRVGPPRLFIIGSDQSSTTMNKLFDQQVDQLIS